MLPSVFKGESSNQFLTGSLRGVFLGHCGWDQIIPVVANNCVFVDWILAKGGN